MQLSWLLSFFENSPAIGLLRSKHAPFVIDFLSSEFKGDGAVSRGMQELTESLRTFLQRLHDTHPDILTDTPENYLSDWCGSNKRYVRRFLDAEHDEPLYELTSSSEDVLTYLHQMAHRDTRFVGTESRLKRIIETLGDLALGASQDVDRRVQHLREQRDGIDRQIAVIEAEGEVDIYTSTAIRERFSDALMDLAQLQGDFRAVEEAFKAITRDVQARQLTSEKTRGQILGEALDAEDGLRGEDQGVSFDEFARLILSPNKQEQVDEIIRQVSEIETLADDHEGLCRIRDMVPSLTAEASKVLRTYQRLSASLRRLLDRDLRSERQRLATVLGEIRAIAVQWANDPQREQAAGWSIDHEVEVTLPTERPFWSPPSEFDRVELKDHETDDSDRAEAFTNLAMLRSLDWQQLRRRVELAIASDGETTLAALLSTGQPQYDAVEVMGLIQIAHEDGHCVDNELTERIQVCHADGTIAELEIPNVVFLNDRISDTPTQRGLA